MLCGCAGATKTARSINATELETDFRLWLITESDLKELQQNNECKFLFLPSPWQTNIFVGKGRQLNDILIGKGNTFEKDSRIVVLKNHQVLRQPGWYETNAASFRASFFEVVIESGDVVWFPPVE